TRSDRDWSSDVCSSDLSPSTTKSSATCRERASATSGYWLATDRRLRDRRRVFEPCRKARQRSPSSLRSKIHPGSENRRSVSVARSEERRVGKEGRVRGG